MVRRRRWCPGAGCRRQPVNYDRRLSVVVFGWLPSGAAGLQGQALYSHRSGVDVENGGG